MLPNDKGQARRLQTLTLAFPGESVSRQREVGEGLVCQLLGEAAQGGVQPAKCSLRPLGRTLASFVVPSPAGPWSRAGITHGSQPRWFMETFLDGEQRSRMRHH